MSSDSQDNNPSELNEKVTDINQESDTQTDESASDGVESINPISTELEKTKKDFLYLRAEFENYKRNAIKERSSLQKFGSQRLALDLLPVLDVFSQALADLKTDQDDDPFVQGIKMTHKELLQSLTKHGIEEVTSLGEPFNPEFHEALGTEPTNEFKEGHVSRIFKAPYKYHDRLLRAGQVFVATPIQEKDN